MITYFCCLHRIPLNAIVSLHIQHNELFFNYIVDTYIYLVFIMRFNTCSMKKYTYLIRNRVCKFQRVTDSSQLFCFERSRMEFR